MTIVAVTGGIGSGKSVVCRLFGMLGAKVYDCDSGAKRLMNGDKELAAKIVELFGAESYTNGTLNRGYLAKIIFADAERRLALDRFVHPAVARDLKLWCERCAASGERYAVVESAILFESGLDRMVDKVVVTDAPREMCIARAMARDGATRSAIEARIKGQIDSSERLRRADYVVENDEQKLLWRQVLALDSIFRGAVEENIHP